ncbi:uncharacterized protein LOC135805256 [Sycon ciliatum]|uniref:uncharacterized protein LOC135805256 n=1 Tax=Sycon ciliatum TaxID=27933 RepID=UPI0031F61A2C
MKVLAVLALFVVAAAAMVNFDLDVNDFVNGFADEMQAMEELTCDCKYGCKPKIVTHPPTPKKKASVIQPVVGNRGNVALIVDYGTCSPTHEGYTWFIDWGDGTTNHSYYKDLLQVQVLHQYDDCGKFCIKTRYCSYYKRVAENATTLTTRGNCDYYQRKIDVTFDPPAGL